MNTPISLSSKILFALLLVSLWFNYQQSHENGELSAQQIQLTEELSDSLEALLASQQKVDSLERNIEQMLSQVDEPLTTESTGSSSVGTTDPSSNLNNLIKQTNKAVVSGWQALIDTMANELEKAQEKIKAQQTPSETTNDRNNSDSLNSAPIIEGERT